MPHNAFKFNSTYAPGPRRGADRGSEEAYRRCCSGPLEEYPDHGSDPVQTLPSGTALDLCLSFDGSATVWTYRPASPGPKTGGTPHLHTEGERL